MKRVHIALEMDEHFVRRLRAQIHLRELGPELPRPHTPMEARAVLARAEAQGATVDQRERLTPREERPHLHVVPDARTVLSEEPRSNE